MTREINYGILTSASERRDAYENQNHVGPAAGRPAGGGGAAGGTDTVRAAPEFAWAYWPCLVWAWAFAVPIFWALVPAWRVCGSIAVKGMAFTGKNARDLRTVSRLAFADAVIFPAGMLIVAYLGAGSAPLTLLITPLVTFCCLAAGIVLYVLSRLVADAAALREDNDLTI